MKAAPSARSGRDEQTSGAVPSVELPAPPRKKQFGTQLFPDTIARLEWAKARGHRITDVVDAAINDYLDRADVPRPGKDGTIREN